MFLMLSQQFKIKTTVSKMYAHLKINYLECDALIAMDLCDATPVDRSSMPCSILMSPTHHTSCPVPVVITVPSHSWSLTSANRTRALTAVPPSTREAALPQRYSWMSVVSVNDGVMGCEHARVQSVPQIIHTTPPTGSPTLSHNIHRNLHCWTKQNNSTWLKLNHWHKYSILKQHLFVLFVSTNLHTMQISRNTSGKQLQLFKVCYYLPVRTFEITTSLGTS